MKRLILLAILIWGCHIGYATHIVGGEIQVVYTGNGDRYRFVVNLYFDQINGNLQAEDRSIPLYIFSKSTNRFVDSVRLAKVDEQFLVFTNPACTNPQIRTRQIRYRQEIELPSSRYDDVQGYYVVWERCCRNNVISNIFNPGNTGSVFYTEFPAVWRNNQRFRNTSPAFSLPKGDFMCLNKPFGFDFSATDIDGDELRYSLITPLAGNTSPDQVIVPPIAGAYQPVSWRPGFSATNAIAAASPAERLTIHPQTGQLKVIPNKLGLYVFGVRVEEWRNGQKIGEVRRDFQFLVLDCPNNASPSVRVQIGTNPDGTAAYYRSGQILTVDASNDRLCFDIYLKDPNPNTTLSLSIIGRNFTPRQPILQGSGGLVRTSVDSVRVWACWPQCLFSERDASGSLKPFVFDLVVADQGCPFPLTDTVRVSLIALPVVNNPPIITTTAPPTTAAGYAYKIEKFVGEAFDFDVLGSDLQDNDLLSLSARGIDLDMTALGMRFAPANGRREVQSRFRWNPNCGVVSELRNEFLVEFVIKDDYPCGANERKVRVLLVVNDTPVSLDFLPNNAFSPNGDGKNETFTMNLPDENCLYRFNFIEIYDRWGKKVYRSEARDFVWDGNNYPAGVYYYRIDYGRKIFKGSISLMK